MKKYASIVILILLTALLPGCQRKETPPTAPTPPVVGPGVPHPPTQPPTEPGPQYLTVAQLLASDGLNVDKVVMAGKVVAQASTDDESYLFADGTGEIRLERDEEDLPVGANIRILGDPESGGCDTYDGRQVCTIEVRVLAWESI